MSAPDDSPPPFHDAVARLRACLKANGRPEAIVWIEAADILTTKSQLRVRLRPPQRMWIKAQCTYELGVERKLGVLLRQVCQVHGLSCCQVYVPKNPNDAAECINGEMLKIAFPGEVRRARAVTNSLHWVLLKMKGSRS